MSQSYSTHEIRLTGLRGIPLVRPGDNLDDILLAAFRENKLRPEDDDVLVLAQKIVSKAEGRLKNLEEVEPSEQARLLANETGKDPRLVELILGESVRVVRQREGLIITEHRLGLVMANAGIDQSNVGEGAVLLLPEDPDASADRIRKGLRSSCGARVAVVIADSIGRAWRNGIVGHAIGVSGLPSLVDLRQTRDMYGRDLRVTEVALADEIAAAATLVMGQGSEGVPAVLVRGFGPFENHSGARSLVRDKAQDLFR